MNASQSHLRSERGAILVFTAIAMLALMGFLAYVVDYGILWVSRAQAQNAADAGALAGAVARAFDETTNPPAAGGTAEDSALSAAQDNEVWNVAPVAQVSWTCPPWMPGSACVRVDVYRNGQFGSTPLPTFFGPILNITTHGVRATATARVAVANATNCMRPWAIADTWQVQVGEAADIGGRSSAAAPTERFDRWMRVSGNVVELTPHDVYTPPHSGGPGTGFRLPDDGGVEQVLQAGNNPNSAIGPVSPGWFLPLRLPDPTAADGFSSGADDFREAIGTCIGHPVTVGQYLPTEDGAMVGPTGQGFADLRDTDPLAHWESGAIADTCAPGCAPQSPRIVPITVFDMDEYQWRKEANNWTREWIPGVGPGAANVAGGVCPTGGGCVRVANILGFFADRMSGNDVIGYLMSMPGEFVVGAPSLGGGAGFLQTIQLVR